MLLWSYGGYGVSSLEDMERLRRGEGLVLYHGTALRTASTASTASRMDIRPRCGDGIIPLFGSYRGFGVLLREDLVACWSVILCPSVTG